MSAPSTARPVRRYLVTGAAGCLGAWVVAELLAAGQEVVATDLTEDRRRLELVRLRPSDDVPWARLDVTDLDALTAVLTENAITDVIHLAGLQVPFCAADPPLGAAVNVVGTVNVFEAVRRLERRTGLVYASSAAVFGAASVSGGHGVRDDALPDPGTHYGVFKVANEGTAQQYWRESGVASVGLRPFVVFGVGRDQGRTSSATSAMLSAVVGDRFELPGGGPALLTLARDCARWFIAACDLSLTRGGCDVWNVPGQTVRLDDLPALIDAHVPGAADLITVGAGAPSAVPSRLEDPALHRVLGRDIDTPLATAVAETVAHFRQALALGILPGTASSPPSSADVPSSPRSTS
ncbi:UDP-glucuronate 4-epimerase [Nocardioides zeae]|uniref:UDP-glucuronate 4-epimerase n=1 Tax=Nocardioides zeae TaxID=1457234 RepID=A0ACC6IEF2_9ACTN|nr:SDR family oxidoreductase [Nocardioides zeae]MDR6174211.1 UDP-glucuronate 4-epimerase [Nocardioides zeae]MDR6209018.1 UDP-glucuronate 4-epimerase [Nocardioides zeae]